MLLKKETTKIFIFLLGIILFSSMVLADSNMPHSVRGNVYYADGTPAGSDTTIKIVNEVTNTTITTNPGFGGVPGFYWVTITANDDDPGHTYAYSDTYWGQTNFSFDSVPNDVDVYLTNQFPNRPPVIENIGNREVNEGGQLTIDVNATDLDQDNLTYGIIESLPSQDSFDTETGIFSWTPTYSDSGIYQVTFTVTDGNYSDNETIIITVNDYNYPVELDPVGNRQATETSQLSVQLSSYNPEGDNVEYSKDVDFGNLNTETGLFSWTPSIYDSGDYEVTFTVTDSVYDDSETITITVNDNGVFEIKPMGTINGRERNWVYIYPEISTPSWTGVNLSITGNQFDWNSANKRFEWQTGYSDSSEYNFNIEAQRGTDSDTKSVHVSIQNNCYYFDKKIGKWNCDPQALSQKEILPFLQKEI